MFGVQSMQGATRNVFLVGRWALKIPRFIEWRLFLHGLLANMQEKTFSGCDVFPDLCPVLWALPGGFLVCMQRATPVPRTWWEDTSIDEWLSSRGLSAICEGKLDCFGMLRGKVVVVDYGSES